MNKIICEMCGTVYPDTAHQCPICGCAKPSDPQMQSGAAVAEDAAAGYTYVKGGRFSKTNVRKRNNMAKAAAMYEQDDMDEDEIPKESNRGLTIAIIVLLLAIIAVAAYIYIRFFAGSGSGKEKPAVTTPVATTTPAITTAQQTTPPPATTPEPTTTVETTPDKSCTGITLVDQSVIFDTIGAAWTLTPTVDPVDTVDQLSFVSSDPKVATVDANGRVVAIGNGNATITVSCGTVSAQCAITVKVPEENKDLCFNTYEPFEGSLNLADSKHFRLQLRDKDRTALEVTNWTSSKPGVATVSKDGLVTAVSTGTTEITCTYEGWVYTCKIIVTAN